MKINLFTSYYQESNVDRLQELRYCQTRNQQAAFDKILILLENDFKDPLLYVIHSGIKFKNIEKRPTFNDFFEIMDSEEYENDINILSNTDIYFSDLTEIVKIFENGNRNLCLALSRWDVQADDTIVHFNRADSQDTWIFYGRPRIRTAENYTLGVAGCDNKLAYELKLANYDVVNPSKTVKTYHFHLSGVRNYIDDNGIVKNRIQPPYLLVNPI